MKDEMEKQLYDKYPMLFRQKDLSAQETCMCWGISCGQGWYKIIDEACEKLTTLAKEENVVIEFAQVKEKFAGLRLYLEIIQDGKQDREVVIDFMSPSGEVNTLMKSPKETIWQKAHEITRKAEELSYQTCDICGEPGEPRQGGWIVTRCDKHVDKKFE
jgi:phosphoribosyl-dephospho-CoA transferase